LKKKLCYYREFGTPASWKKAGLQNKPAKKRENRSYSHKPQTVNTYYNGTTYTTLLTTFSQFLCLVMFLLYSTVSPNLNEGRKRGLTMGLG